MQGACQRGSSCIRTALSFQETIAHNLIKGKKVSVTHYSISKVFDRVWINGLFLRLYRVSQKKCNELHFPRLQGK